MKFDQMKTSIFSIQPLKFGSTIFQSIQVIWFGKLGIWARFIGAYLRAVESILKTVRSPGISSNYQFLNSGVATKILNLWIFRHWSHQVNDAQPSCAWSLFTINNQIWYLSFFPREDLSFRFPGNGANMLSLRQISKAEEEIPTEVTTNQYFGFVSIPIKP